MGGHETWGGLEETERRHKEVKEQIGARVWWLWYGSWDDTIYINNSALQEEIILADRRKTTTARIMLIWN